MYEKAIATSKEAQKSKKNIQSSNFVVSDFSIFVDVCHKWDRNPGVLWIYGISHDKPNSLKLKLDDPRTVIASPIGNDHWASQRNGALADYFSIKQWRVSIGFHCHVWISWQTIDSHNPSMFSINWGIWNIPRCFLAFFSGWPSCGTIKNITRNM